MVFSAVVNTWKQPKRTSKDLKPTGRRYSTVEELTRSFGSSCNFVRVVGNWAKDASTNWKKDKARNWKLAQ